MFSPCTFKYPAVCTFCGGAILSGTRGERDREKRLNHCALCTQRLTEKAAREKQGRINMSMKVD